MLRISFSKVLHKIQSGNDGDLDTARSLYMKISCVRARPLSFFVRQGKAPPDIPENVAGSRDYFTEDTVCRLLMKKRTRDEFLTLCLRNIWLLTSKNDIDLQIQHIEGHNNPIAVVHL